MPGDGAINLLDVMDGLLGLSPAERKRRMEELGLCDADRAEMEGWLAHHDSGTEFLAHPPAAVADAIRLLRGTAPAGPSLTTHVRTVAAELFDLDGDAPPPQLPKIENYQVTGRLGEGGMGEVWRAVQLSTRREVALKLMSPACFASARSRRRFDREVELTARLEHPNIARVYDSGLRVGACFYAMELVESGLPMDEYAKVRGLGSRQVLALMGVVCRAVQHAHQRGVIHRDLKPSNILVDREGRPHVMDFGLAKAVQEAKDAAPLDVSVEGEVTGTPAFMSPEQAAGRVRRIDTRSDVYSLGVILYRLLTGSSPHDLSGSRSQVLARITHNEVINPRIAKADLDPELQVLLLKALAKEPERRYSSAGELAADLDNYLNGEPLTARPPTLAYFVSKRLRRHRLLAAAALGVLALLAGMAVLSYWRITRERNAARVAEVYAQNQAGVAREERRTAELRRAAGLVSEGDVLGSVGQWDQAKSRYRDAFSVFSRESVPVLRADLGLWNACRNSPPPLHVFAGIAPGPGGAGAVSDVAVTPDGRTAVTGSPDGTVRVWDLIAGRAVFTLAGHRGNVWSVSLARQPSGALTALTGGADGKIVLWDVTRGAALRTFDWRELGPQGWVTLVALSSDGRFAVSASGETEASSVSLRDDAVTTLTVWDVAAGKWIRQFRVPGRVVALALSPDGSTLLTAGKAMSLWDVAGGRKVRDFPDRAEGATGGSVLSVALSADGRSALSGNLDGTVTLWDMGRGAGGGAAGAPHETWTIRGHAAEVRAVTFAAGASDAEGSVVVSAGEDQTIVLRDAATGRVLRGYDESRGPGAAVAVSAGGGFALCVAKDGTLSAFGLRPTVEVRAFPRAAAPVMSAAFFPDGRLVLTQGADGLTVRDVATGQDVLRLGDASAPADGAALSPDGTRVALVSGETLSLWDVALARRVSTAPIGHRARPPVPLAFSPDGQTILMAAADHSLSLRRVFDGKELLQLRGHTAAVTSLAFSPDGRWALSGSRDHTVRLWDLASGRELRTFTGHRDAVNAVAFSPDGSTAFSAGGRDSMEQGEDDFTVRAWDLSGRTPDRIWPGHDGPVRALAVCPNGLMVASASDDGLVKLWDSKSGQELRTLAGHRGPVQCVAFSRDGLALLSGGQDRAPLLWDFSTPSRRRALGPSLQRATLTLPSKPADGESMRALGEWYAMHQVWDWAADALERARAGGTAVSPVTLAHCYWALGRLDEAATELQRAAAQKDAPESYLSLCLAAVSREREAQRAAATRPAEP